MSKHVLGFKFKIQDFVSEVHACQCLQVNNTPPLQPLPSVDAYKDLSLFVSVRICIAYGIDRCIRSCLIRFQLFSNPGTVERHRRR